METIACKRTWVLLQQVRDLCG